MCHTDFVRDNVNLTSVLNLIFIFILNLLLFKVFIILTFCGFFPDPSPSVTKDKSRPDLAGSPSDGLLQPDGEKAFYENLPFHGMQSAPNKVNALYVITCILLLTEQIQHFSNIWI